MPEPAITSANPNIFNKVIDSPKKNPSTAAIATLPPIMTGPPTEIDNPEPYAFNAKKSIAKAQTPASAANKIPLGLLYIVIVFICGIKKTSPRITAVRETIIAPNK